MQSSRPDSELDHDVHDNERQKLLASNETRAVGRRRYYVHAALVVAAAVMATGVYLLSSRANRNLFEGEFLSSAAELQESFQSIVEQKLGAIASLGVTFTSYARSNNHTWPAVTINDYQERAATVRRLSDSLLLEILPIVTNATREMWEEHVEATGGWLQEGRDYQRRKGFIRADAETKTNETSLDDRILQHIDLGLSKEILVYDETFQFTPETGPGPYYPIWQSSPVLDLDLINFNLNFFPQYRPFLQKSANEGQVSMGRVNVAPPGYPGDPDTFTDFFANLLSMNNQGKRTFYNGDPMSNVWFPVFEDHTNTKVVAVMLAVIQWGKFFQGVLRPNSQAIYLVLEDTCGGPFTYRVDGKNVDFVGQGDLHNTDFSKYGQSTQFNDIIKIEDEDSLGVNLNQDNCAYTLTVYPTEEFFDEYNNSIPIVMTAAVLLVFVFTAIMFILYDRIVEQRQKVVLTTAVESSAIVSDLFPVGFRERMIGSTQESNSKGDGENRFLSENQRLKRFLGGKDSDNDKPLADLFPHCTVLFADLANFTSWSSTRSPDQVFILLQTIYQAFDKIAASLKVFKVETIGDCYLCVTGLPNAQPDHAIIMAKFASQAVRKMQSIVQHLQVRLGPGTAELGMRFGMHSGPVTAGVLRGERARFQLFGDTCNFAARIENSGTPNMIHASRETAMLLREANKESWVIERESEVKLKGKGVVNTFWIDAEAPPGSVIGSGHATLGATEQADDRLEKEARLVDWITNVLVDHTKDIVASRTKTVKSTEDVTFFRDPSKTNLDEVVEVIVLPKLRKNVTLNKVAEVPQTIVNSLRHYVAAIAAMYRSDVSFHTFEHVSHMTMTANKFLKRIVAPDIDSSNVTNADMDTQLFDFTHGINSDPLTHFAIVFSALIHDVDHRGISNTQLCKENKPMADIYRNKSVAEQNSLDLAWNLLMEDSYSDLRRYLFGTRSELLRFRQIVVNLVLATDIFDKELNDLRKKRWTQAFSEDSKSLPNHNGLRATIVLEHIIQASDVSHTMQHWHVYRKWNQRLFTEMYTAYKAGRMGADPSTFWYKGELSFFDNYIIPLAKKLKDCNVFGVSSDECLNYALLNRAEWETKGEQILADMLQDIQKV